MRSLILVATFVLSLTAIADAGDGVQILPDATRILVSKDVGTERWAITLDLGHETPLNVSGNVFRRDGGPAAFVWCSIQDVTGDPNDIRNALFTWSCFGSDRCESPPCGDSSQWQFISAVTLPGRFFLP
jgi:hypothetical protein